MNEMEATLDDVFSLKEVAIYGGGLAILVAGWFWANPMKRLSAVERDLTDHKVLSASQHSECKIELLEHKAHVISQYSTKTETIEGLRRLEDSQREGFKEIKAILNQQTLSTNENFRTLSEQINHKQDKS